MGRVGGRERERVEGGGGREKGRMGRVGGRDRKVLRFRTVRFSLKGLMFISIFSPFPSAMRVTPATLGERRSFSDKKLRGGTKKRSTWVDECAKHLHDFPSIEGARGQLPL